jgi:phosphate transport system substrate-binding protein
VAVPIERDAISIVVGIDNPFRRGLSDLQVKQIFRGEILDWSEVNGKSSSIKVVNRPNISGTRQVFQQEVLQGGEFGSGNNFITMNRDATTPILQALGNNGISYATYAQVVNQQTIRTVAINGLTPEAENYPYQRTLYYVYQNPPTPEVKAFLGYALSPEGKSSIGE